MYSTACAPQYPYLVAGLCTWRPRRERELALSGTRGSSRAVDGLTVHRRPNLKLYQPEVIRESDRGTGCIGPCESPTASACATTTTTGVAATKR